MLQTITPAVQAGVPPSTLSIVLDVIDKGSKIVGILIAGAWGYLNYRRGRTFEHRLEPTISGKLINSRGIWILTGVAQLKNVGLSKASIQQRGTAVELHDLVLAVSGNCSARVTRVDLAVLEVFEEHAWIEPGETIDHSFIRALPVRTDRVGVRLGLRIISDDIEWNADSIAELPGAAPPTSGNQQSENEETKQHISGQSDGTVMRPSDPP